MDLSWKTNLTFSCDLHVRIRICTYLCFPIKGTPALIIRLMSCYRSSEKEVKGRALESSSIFKKDKWHLVMRLQRHATKVNITSGKKSLVFSDLWFQSQEKCLAQQFLRVSVQWMNSLYLLIVIDLKQLTAGIYDDSWQTAPSNYE